MSDFLKRSKKSFKQLFLLFLTAIYIDDLRYLNRIIILCSTTGNSLFMKRIAFFLVIIFQFPTMMHGQDSSFINPGYDTSYIKSYRDKLIITFVSTSNSNTITVSDSLGEQVSFATNLPTSFGFALDYKWLTAEYTTSFGRAGPEEYGYTSLRSIGFGLTGRKLWFRNFYQKTKGY